MPSYKVLQQGFFNGRLYDPKGKRPVLHTEEPFPFKVDKDGKKTKVEDVPSWVERMKEEDIVQVSTGITVKELKSKLESLNVEFKSNATKAVLIEQLEIAELTAKVAADKKEIDEASFMGEGEKSKVVETL